MRRSSASARTRLAALVLAAGGSTRLGRPKQLLRRHGETLLLRTCRLARAVAGENVIVVLGADALRMRRAVRRRYPTFCIAHNARWREGMAGSIRAGLVEVPAGTAGLLILLVDQARIEARDLRLLAARGRRSPARAAAALHSGRPGAPAIIPRRSFRDLRSLEGDTGARQLLGRLRDVSPVAMPAAAIDVDTAADLARL
jgi:molybdenum cofactor cytidylyltransferase